MQIDKIILSANDNPLYLPFLRIVAPAWEKLMGIRPTLIYVSDDPLENAWMESFAEVIRVPNVDGVPSGNHAMASRMLMSTLMGSKVCMLADIDLLPLSSWYYNQSAEGVPDHKFLFMNGDAYGPGRKFPICHIVAKGDTFKEVLNPRGLPYQDLMASYRGFKGLAQYCDITTPYTTTGSRFCDETLLQSLFNNWDHYVERTVVVPRAPEDTTYGLSVGRRIDRSDWRYSEEALAKGLYVDSHLVRPFAGNEHLLAPLVNSLGMSMPDKESV